MIDLTRIQIPIKREHFIESVCRDTGRTIGGEMDIRVFQDYGVQLAAGNIDRDENGNQQCTRLYHPFATIPSSNSSLAYKIRAGGNNYFPHVELNASPAKLLQAHNAYGTVDFEKCISAPLQVFYDQFPGIQNVLDYYNAEIMQMDFTYSAHVDSLFVAKQVIEALRHISAGQVRLAKETYETSVMWNAGSEHCVREAYLKYFEVKHQIEKLTKLQKQSPNSYQALQLQTLQSAPVQQFIQNVVRFEAKCKKRMFKRMGIPTRIKDLINYAEAFEGCLSEHMWRNSFSEIFSTFEGADVNVYDDEKVLESLKKEYFKITKTGRVSHTKAKRLFRFFRAIKNEGLAQVKESWPDSTYFDNMKELTAVIPRAYLQNLHSVKTNIIPLVKLVNVDFAKQHPVGYVEPLHMSMQMDKSLSEPIRLVG